MAITGTHTGPKAGLLITAAGFSTRMGGKTKKEYQPIGKLPVLIYNLVAFLDAVTLEEIIITVPEEHESRVETLLRENLPNSHSLVWDRLEIVPGGETRQESVHRGLEAFTRKIQYCLIQDGARPWVSSPLIRRVLRDCIANEASIPVVPVTDAVKRVDVDGNIEAHLSRSTTVGAQTPQAFSFPSILDAHRRAKEDGNTYIDDSEIFTRYCGPVHTIIGDPENIKITFPRDLLQDSSEQGR